MVKPGKIKVYGLVRDENGKPKFDNLKSTSDIPRPIWDMLTSDEQQELINGYDNSPHGGGT